MSLTEFPVNVTIPLTGSTGSGHSAAQKKYVNNHLPELHIFGFRNWLVLWHCLVIKQSKLFQLRINHTAKCKGTAGEYI